MIDVTSTAPDCARPAPAQEPCRDENFLGQTAVITGASGGIGRAIARQLAARGATVCLLGRRREVLEELAGSLRRGLVFPVDLSEPAAIRGFVEDLEQAKLRADILVHSAGVIGIGAVESAPLEQLEWQLRVNLSAPYLLSQMLLPMLKLRRGQIVFINSNAGLSAVRCSSQYSATKHALKAVAESLRQEINPSGVRIMDIFIGRTATPMQAKLHAMEGKCYAPERFIQPEDVASMVIHALCMRRSVEVTAIHMRPMAPGA
jgi:short-subunit dehydrogenase